MSLFCHAAARNCCAIHEASPADRWAKPERTLGVLSVSETSGCLNQKLMFNNVGRFLKRWKALKALCLVHGKGTAGTG